MLQFPWLLTGVVIVETLFNYRGFGWLLIEGGGEQRHRPAARLLDRRGRHRARHAADLRHRLRLPQPADPGGLMELEFLSPWADRRRHPRPLPAGLDRAWRRSWCRASSSGAGSAPTGRSTTAASASSGFGAGAVLAPDRADGALGGALRPLRAGPGAAEQGRPARSTPELGLPYLFGGDALGRDVFSPHGLRQPHGDGDRTPGDALRLHGRHHPRAAGRLFRRLARHPALASSPTSCWPSR